MNINLKEIEEWKPYFYIAEKKMREDILERANHLPRLVREALLFAMLIADGVHVYFYIYMREWQKCYNELYKSIPKKYLKEGLGIYLEDIGYKGT